jgi:DNA-binding MarR family transcriptional regulator
MSTAADVAAVPVDQPVAEQAAAGSLQVIEREVGVLLRRVRRTSTEIARSIHPELAASSYPILLHVIDHEPVRATQIVEHLGIDKGAVSRQVAQLERLGLIERAEDPDDKRAQTLVLSARGRERLQQVARERSAAMAHRLAAWNEEELAQFARRLGRYNASLEA